MVRYRRHRLETHSNVEPRRLKAVRRNEHDAASLRARVLLNRSHELTANPLASHSLCYPHICDVAATAPRVPAYSGLDVAGAAFTDRSNCLLYTSDAADERSSV